MTQPFKKILVEHYLILHSYQVKSQSHPITFLRNIFNISNQDTLQKTLIDNGILPVLLKQLSSEEEHVVVMTIRAISNIFDGLYFFLKIFFMIFLNC